MLVLSERLGRRGLGFRKLHVFAVRPQIAASWVRKRSCNFSTDAANLRQNFDKQLQISTKKIMGAQNFDFGPKFFKTMVFSFKFSIFGCNMKKKLSDNFPAANI